MNGTPWWGWVLAVAAGSAGALLRTWLVAALPRRPLPVGVLTANVAASVVGGAVVATRADLGPTWTLVLVGGTCGGLSTLSTLAADTVELWREERRGGALGNLLVNLVLGLAGAWLGWWVLS